MKLGNRDLKQTTPRSERMDRLRANAAGAHREAILKSLDHRLQVAKNKGDQKLVDILEAERQRYV
jgi:hypothetical protein